jgi:hypothetical protein
MLLLFAQRYTQHLTATIVSFKNTLDWVTGDDVVVATSAKIIGSR